MTITPLRDASVLFLFYNIETALLVNNEVCRDDVRHRGKSQVILTEYFPPLNII